MPELEFGVWAMSTAACYLQGQQGVVGMVQTAASKAATGKGTIKSNRYDYCQVETVFLTSVVYE